MRKSSGDKGRSQMSAGLENMDHIEGSSHRSFPILQFLPPQANIVTQRGIPAAFPFHYWLLHRKPQPDDQGKSLGVDRRVTDKVVGSNGCR